MHQGKTMSKAISSIVAALSLAAFAASPASAQQTVVVAVTAKAGIVNGTKQNSDAFIWKLFTEFTAPVIKTAPKPVIFETWASDADTFNPNPVWPSPTAARKFQASVLQTVKSPHPGTAIDAPCKAPGNAAVGGFPSSGTPTPCIAEETKRNKPQFDYIVANGLNTQAGLKAAYAKSFVVTMPTSAIAVKGDWIPLPTLLQWIPNLGSIDNIRKFYFTTTSESVEYALVALHVSSRQNPNWVWGSFEHQFNPGRCDNLGCFDSFGATKPAVLPNKSAVNTQYGACTKTKPLLALMAAANLSPVWQNYCLKSSQVDYTAADKTPYALGNSVIERIVGNGTVSASSCIGCHVYASFGANGAPTGAATAMLPYNPTGNPIMGVLAGSIQYDFMWGVLLAP